MAKPNGSEFCWNELATRNVQAAKEFYGKIFGWEFTDEKTGDMTYTVIKNKEEGLGGIWQIPDEKKDKIPPHWLGYVSVENLEHVVKEAEKLGATIIVQPKPVGDWGRFAVIEDPVGAHLAFWQSNSA